MPKKVTTEEIISKAISKYGDRFDFDKTVFSGMKEPITITCRIHGDFTTTPYSFLQPMAKHGCPVCGMESSTKNRTHDTKWFLQKAKEKYGDKFDYSKSIYTKGVEPITIICPKHGEFSTTPDCFLAKARTHGCPSCGNEAKNIGRELTQEEYMKRVIEKYGNRFNYNKLIYKGMNHKVTVICYEHGEFSVLAPRLVSPSNIYGCPKCGHDAGGSSRKYTTEKFIKEATARFGTLYSYNKSICSGWTEKIIITCKVHGDIETTPSKFLSKSRKIACPLCAVEQSLENKRLSLEQFKERIEEKYNGIIYCPEGMTLHNTSSNINMICRIHGEFSTTANRLLSSHVYHGCPDCGKESGILARTYTNEEFISLAKVRFGDTIDYSKVSYINANSKVTFTCSEHGDFEMFPFVFLRNSRKFACPKCNIIDRGLRDRTPESEILTRLVDKFGEALEPEFRKLNMVEKSKESTLVCNIHGEFNTSVERLLNPFTLHFCPECGFDNTAKLLSNTTEEFIALAKERYGDLYDYSKSVYTGARKKLTITCKIHGDVEINPYYFLTKGHDLGCTKCSTEYSHKSFNEHKIAEFIESTGFEIDHNNRKIIKPKELDLVIHNQKLAIEYCGNYWHSDAIQKDRNYHLNKLEQTTKQGYRLLTIFEDEWVEKPEIVKQIIKRALNASNPTIIGARKTSLIIPTRDEAKEFFNAYHLQGSRLGQYLFALTYDNTIVSAISVGKRDIYGGQAEYEVIRYASNPDYYIAGGLSKMMRHLLKTTEVKSALSYVDRRWFNGSEYHKNGFKQIKITKPGYYYVKGLKRHHRAQFQKHKLSKVLENFDQNLTEVQNMTNHGYHRIFDCGQILFRYGAPPIP